jgi:hypothetical protein
LQGFKLKDIRDFHVLIVGNDRQLKDIKNVAECNQFAHSFTGSELKTNCRHGEGYWGSEDKRKTRYFWWKSREFLDAVLSSINQMLISKQAGI